MPGRKINWMRTLLIIGLTCALAGIRIIFSFYSVIDDDLAYSLSLLVERGVLESVIALFLAVVIAWNTRLDHIKKALYSVRPQIVIASLFLVGGVIMGILLQGSFQGLFQSYFEELSQVADKIDSMPMYQQTVFIFGNNSGVAVLSGIFAAFFPLVGALFPPFVMGLNGLIIGLAPGVYGLSWSHFLVAILPHGILEIPALVLASAVGLKLNISILKAGIGYLFPPQGMSRGETFLREIKPGWFSLKLFAVIIPMLVVAAIIEIYVSTQIVEVLGI